MSDEFDHHHFRYLRRKRRLRRWLRRLPRKAAIRRANLPQWVKTLAQKSWYMWSFQRGPVARAIYFGSVLALLPLFGIQFPLAVLLSWAVRANLPLTMVLQLLTNPFTIVPVYGFTYLVGYTVMQGLSDSSAGYNPGLAIAAIKAGEFGGAGHALIALTIGGLIVGLATALVFDFGWRLLRWEAAVFKRKLESLREKRLAAAKATSDAAPADRKQD